MIGKRNRAVTAVIGVLIASLCLPVSGAAADYEVYGSIDAAALYHYTEDPPAGDRTHDFSAFSELLLKHTLYYPAGSLTAYHGIQKPYDGEITHTVYNLKASLNPASWLSFTAGKQKFGLGSGYAFHPGDILVRHGSYRAEAEGVASMGITVTPSYNYTVSGAVGFDNALDVQKDEFWEEAKLLGYANGYFGNLDVTAAFGYKKDEIIRPGIYLSADIAGFIITADVAAEFNNTIEYPDFGKDGIVSLETLSLKTYDKGKPFPMADISLQKTLINGDFSFMWITEYYFHSLGYTKDQTEHYLTLLAQATQTASTSDSASSGESTVAASGMLQAPDPVGRHYIYQSVGFDWMNHFSFENSVVWNILDYSLSSRHMLTASFFQGINPYTEVKWFWAEEDKSEFGSVGGNTYITLGVKVHY